MYHRGDYQQRALRHYFTFGRMAQRSKLAHKHRLYQYGHDLFFLHYEGDASKFFAYTEVKADCSKQFQPPFTGTSRFLHIGLADTVSPSWDHYDGSNEICASANIKEEYNSSQS